MSGPSLPGEAEPAQVFEHGRDEIQPETHGVEILVAQDERAAGGAGALGGDPKRACMAEMQMPGGRGRETPAIGMINHRFLFLTADGRR